MAVAAWLFGVSGVLLAVIGAFFAIIRPPLLPEDIRFLGRTLGEFDAFAPQLRRWLRLVFRVLGGQAAAAGGLTVFVAAAGVRRGDIAAVVALVVSGIASTGLMAAVNIALRSDFRWPLLVLAGLWPIAAATAVWFP